MKIKENASLNKYNTFNIDVKAKYLVELESKEECLDVLDKYKDEKILILGGGSNILFVNDWNGIVLRPVFKGINIIEETENTVLLEVAAGEEWDSFVRWCVEHDYAGVENMVLIPGSVGGAVSQNIAAYGQNITDTLTSITAIELSTKKEITLKPEECGYEYRRSNFKNIWKNKYLITSATFELKKNNKEFELSYHERAGRYGSLKEELDAFAKEPYSIQDVMEAIIRQRNKRLPKVEDLGTCGSFFENPVVTVEKYNELAKKMEDLQSYPVENLSYNVNTKDQLEGHEYVKIPAGRLLDELGWKGKWDGNVGVFEKHALCVVTNKKATGEEVISFIEKMKDDVKKNYGVELVTEVNIIN